MVFSWRLSFSRQKKICSSLSKGLSGESLLSTIYRAFPISVLLGTIAKQHHVLDLPDWFLEWVSPFLLMAFGYKARRKITEVVENRRDRRKDTREE
jgi:hypothetical protein